MERSFKLNGIGYVRFDQKQRRGEDVVKRFKTSDEIQVFMLHSQSQSFTSIYKKLSNVKGPDWV